MASRLRSALWGLPLLGALSTLGCDPESDQLRSLDLAELPDRFACADVTVVAASMDGSEALLIGVEDGLVAAALESGQIVEAEYTLPDNRLTVRWVEGSNVYAGHCGRDSSGEWHLDSRRDAVSGTIVVRIAPESAGSLSLSADLDDLRLAPTDASDAPIYELSATILESLDLEP